MCLMIEPMDDLVCRKYICKICMSYMCYNLCAVKCITIQLVEYEVFSYVVLLGSHIHVENFSGNQCISIIVYLFL